MTSISHKPSIEKLREAELQYLFTARPSSQEYVYQEIESLERLASVPELLDERNCHAEIPASTTLRF